MGRRGGLEVRPPFKPHVPITPEECFEGFNQWFERYGNTATTRRFKAGGNGSKTSACAGCAWSPYGCVHNAKMVPAMGPL